MITSAKTSQLTSPCVCVCVCVQVKACAWAGVVCIVMCVANINSAELDVKSIMSAGS